MTHNFSSNCDWVREKFNLPITASIYEVVNVLTEYVKKIDLKSQKGEEQCQNKKLKMKRE